MSTPPVTMLVARRAAPGRYAELIAWLQEGEHLATDFPGYLGSGILAPPRDDNEFQMIFRFADAITLYAWEYSASRQAWLQRGDGLFAQPSERRIQGMDGWFGAPSNAAEPARPPRWKQAVAIWLAFFPMSLAFNFCFGPWLGELALAPRILVSTLALTPLMVFIFIPLSTRVLAPWLNAPPRAASATKASLLRK